MSSDWDDVYICEFEGDTYYKYKGKVYGFSGIGTIEEVKNIVPLLKTLNFTESSEEPEATWLTINEFILLEA